MLYLNCVLVPFLIKIVFYLTLTNVVFEFVKNFSCLFVSVDLTLTNVVFELKWL